ncbi:MAG: hypothetical protein M3457_08675 [Chloroflexota bacterium]|nr:hypothetical protein [Chloroflexota bacterium]
MQSPPAETPSDDGAGKSRLDRELDEILSKNENIRLLPPPPQAPKAPRSKPSPPRAGSSFESMIPPKAMDLMTSPIVLALGLAIVALLVSGISALLANMLSLAAVVCIMLPMMQRFRGRPTAPPDIRMWRGQVVDSEPPQQPSPIDAARDWWKSRQR